MVRSYRPYTVCRTAKISEQTKSTIGYLSNTWFFLYKIESKPGKNTVKKIRTLARALLNLYSPKLSFCIIEKFR